MSYCINKSLDFYPIVWKASSNIFPSKNHSYTTYFQGNERKNKTSPNKPKTADGQELQELPTDVKVQEQRNSAHRNYSIPDIVVRQPKDEQEKDSSRFRRPSLKLLPPANTIDQLSDNDNMSIVSETSSAGGESSQKQSRKD